MKRGKKEILFADHLSIHIRPLPHCRQTLYHLSYQGSPYQASDKLKRSESFKDSDKLTRSGFKKKKIISQPFLCIKTYLLDLKYKVYQNRGSLRSLAKREKGQVTTFCFPHMSLPGPPYLCHGFSHLSSLVGQGLPCKVWGREADQGFSGMRHFSRSL